MTQHYFYQKSGKLADAAKSIMAAAKIGDWVTCQRTWKQVTGRDTLQHNMTNYVWWMYAATEHIITASHPTNDGIWEHAVTY